VTVVQTTRPLLIGQGQAHAATTQVSPLSQRDIPDIARPPPRRLQLGLKPPAPYIFII